MNTSLLETITHVAFLLSFAVLIFLFFVIIENIKTRKNIPDDPEEALPFYEKRAQNNKIIFESFIILAIIFLPIFILATIFINIFHIIKVVCWSGIFITSAKGYLANIELRKTITTLRKAIEERNELRKKYFPPHSSNITKDFEKTDDSE